ncbi:hypothetical protein B9S64_30485 [Streptomyces sp. SM18]|nr:hypothetical protein B9S64_30485 [Streptomyces sp. SM18]
MFLVRQVAEEHRGADVSGGFFNGLTDEGRCGVLVVFGLRCAAGEAGGTVRRVEKHQDAAVRYRGSMRCLKDRWVI